MTEFAIAGWFGETHLTRGALLCMMDWDNDGHDQAANRGGMT